MLFRSEASIQALALQGEHAVSLLLSKLDDTSRPIRVSSAMGLAKIGDLSVAPLLENFYQKDREGRFWILQALRNLNVSVVQSIFQSLCYDEDPDLQVLSLASLAQYPADDETLFIIIDLLEHDQWKVRNEACNTLSRLEGVEDDFFITHLRKGTANRKFWMIRAMQKRAAESFIVPLIEVLINENWELKIAACEALRGYHKYDQRPFFEALKEADDNARFWITKSLVGCRDPEAIEIMKGFLDAQHLGIRQNAVAFFQSLGASVAAFLRMLFQEKHSRRVYSLVVDLIAELKQERQNIMLELLSSKLKEEVYWGSILAGKIGPKALSAVHELLESSDWKLRSNGLVAIKQIGSPSSMTPVMELLEDEYFSIQIGRAHV